MTALLHNLPSTRRVIDNAETSTSCKFQVWALRPEGFIETLAAQCSNGWAAKWTCVLLGATRKSTQGKGQLCTAKAAGIKDLGLAQTQISEKKGRE
jgi:hypothetical protein